MKVVDRKDLQFDRWWTGRSCWHGQPDSQQCSYNEQGSCSHRISSTSADRHYPVRHPKPVGNQSPGGTKHHGTGDVGLRQSPEGDVGGARHHLTDDVGGQGPCRDEILDEGIGTLGGD